MKRYRIPLALLIVLAGCNTVGTGITEHNNQTPGALGAEQADWSFIWVASGADRYSIDQGRAVVTFEGSTFRARLRGADGVEYTLAGTIDKEKVKATFSVIGSDYFMDSPFTGEFQSKRWTDFANSQGRDSFALIDGWNLIGMSREIREP